jgi:hypothetical protein
VFLLTNFDFLLLFKLVVTFVIYILLLKGGKVNCFNFFFIVEGGGGAA